MKISLASDLHLEFGDLNLQNVHDSDVLILAGDILTSQELHDFPEEKISDIQNTIEQLLTRRKIAQNYRNFLKRVSFQFPEVIYIAGNHEFYNGKWLKTLEILRDECSKFTNVHFLEDNSVTINDTLFVGGTLWTDMNRGDPNTLHAIASVMNDYRVIRHDGLGYTKLRPAHTISRHRNTMEFFKSTVENNKDKKIVVVSHMAPSHMSIHEQYKGDYINNGAYYSDLSNFILDNPQIKLWCHGHVHNPFDYMIGTTRILCNPRGYVNYDRGSQEDDPYYVQTVEI